MKNVKTKIQAVKNAVRWIKQWIHIKALLKGRIKKIENNIVSAYVKILGRYPDNKRRYMKDILYGVMSLESIGKRLMGTHEYKERLNKFCRMYGVSLKNVPQGFISPLLPGDPAFNEGEIGYQGYEIDDDKDEDIKDKSVTFVSTWNIKCGIATYTGYLTREIKKTGLSIGVVSINSGIPDEKIGGKIVHVQHEFGIIPKTVKTDHKALVTWHTVKEDMGDAVKQFESIGNAVGHIVHSEEAASYLKSLGAAGKDIYVVHHGSKKIPQIKKEDARELLGLENLGIRNNDEFGFIFGFQSGNKMYNETIEASKRAGIKLVISGAVHECGHTENVAIKDNVVFLGKYLNDAEIDLWALSSDLLLFNYKKQKHYSVSGALHRIIGAGRPVICSRTRHFTDVAENKDVLKFEGQKELEQKIREGLDRKDELGKRALEYAIKSSWENAAKRHIEIYKKHMNLNSIPDRFDAAYYDKDYFAVKNGKSFEDSDGSIRYWSYANPGGEWLGCGPIVKAWEELFRPKNVLDIGCGRGTFIGYLRGVGIEAAGFDFSEFAVNHPYPKCNKEWIRKWDAIKTPWPYENNSFDLVIVLDLMEHIYEDDIDKVISEIYRVTGKYAFLQIATVGGGSGYEIHEKEYILKKGETVPMELQGSAVAGHVTVCDETYWMQKFKKAGWITRKNLVEEFCRIVPKDVIANWISNTIIILEKIS